MRTCIGTKSKQGCDKELPDDAFKLSSINRSTGKHYLRNICRKCDNRGKRKPKAIVKPDELGVYKLFDRLMRT